jgi:hypothetical protein
LEKHKIYLGVKYVELVVRPYRTRDAFTNLSSSPPTIYLNEHLIDDEEVVDIPNPPRVDTHKAPQYPPTSTARQAYHLRQKFESNLYFFIPKEKVEEIREKMVKKLIEVNRRLQ